MKVTKKDRPAPDPNAKRSKDPVPFILFGRPWGSTYGSVRLDDRGRLIHHLDGPLLDEGDTR